MQTSNRRLFLGSAAAAWSTVGATQGDTVSVALVGVGNRGSFLLPRLLALPGVRVAALCDIRPEALEAAHRKAAEAGQIAEGFSDYRRMLDTRKDIDAVVLATPDPLHKDMNIAILEMGLHLYAEKPLALTAADGRAIVQAARNSRKVFQVGFQIRHDPRRSAAVRFIHSGGLGRLLCLHATRHGHDIPRHLTWYFDREQSGDIIVDQGIHILDLFTWCVGQHPLRAMGSGGTSLFRDEPKGRTIMDNYSLIYEYPDGVRMNFSHHYFDPPGFTGTRERVFGSLGAADLIAGAWYPRERAGEIRLPAPEAGADATQLSLAAFIENVRKNARPLNDAESAYRSLIVALMGRQAIYERRIVTWEEVA